MRKWSVIALVALFVAPAAYGTGFLMPDDTRWGGLRLESHRVAVEIEEQSAQTKVVEVFRNQHSAQLEATFVFPLPKTASVSDFKMYVNGRLVTGDIVEAGQARRIYEDIVRRVKDPGLLEYMDSRLLKLRVFPIPPNSTQEVQITYNEALAADEGLVEYVYPLKTPSGFAQTLSDFTLTVNIASAAGVKNVYSPTHDITVRQRDDQHVTAGFEKSAATLDRDFHLFYEISKKDFGVSLLSDKPGGKDGYFMLLLSPKVDLSAEDIAPKDVAFVLDTSGSMQGEKIEQARKALLFCINSLNAKDRLNVIAFNIAAERLSGELLDATAENRKKADDFVDQLKPSGGTNIDEALNLALTSKREAGRPYVIVFLTDGLPTVGETNIDRILDNVKKANTAGVRIFPFGVGYDVNTHLLDQVSQVTKGASQYVEPGENLEVKVSSFFKRIGDPVMSDVEIDFGRAGAYDIFPPHAGDIFRGSQLVLTGRYRTAGGTTVTAKGKGPKGQIVFEYPVEFSDKEGRAGFIENVWAGRKIAYLLGEIRLHGENAELKEEVIRLSKEFGIVTPYTSYLVTEGSPIARQVPRRIPLMEERFMGLNDRPRSGGGSARNFDIIYSGGPAASAPAGKMSSAEAERLKSLGYVSGSGVREQASSQAATATGKAAVVAADSYASLVGARIEDKGRIMRSAGGKTFVNIDGVWIDDAVKDDQKVIKIKFGSPEYFELYGKAGKLKDAFGLGENVIIAVGNWCLVIGDELSEASGAEDIKAFTAVLEGLK
jgi:Ca-activated chloride channel family protein